MCKTFRNEYSYTADHTLHISYKLTKTLGIQVLQGKKKKRHGFCHLIAQFLVDKSNHHVVITHKGEPLIAFSGFSIWSLWIAVVTLNHDLHQASC